MPAFIPVRVVSITDLSASIVGIRLQAVNSVPLPCFDAGAHIELQLASGLKRAYSLTSDPADPSHYTIAVGRNDESRGGSRYLCDESYEGELMLVSPPGNSFTLSGSAKKHVFVAGGIGITPFIPMAKEALRRDASSELHVAFRSDHDVPRELLDTLSGCKVVVYCPDKGTRLSLPKLLADAHDDPDSVYYFCGPQRMLSEARQLTQSWLPVRARFESFASAPAGKVAAGAPFKVTVVRDGRSFMVGSNETLLEKLRAEGYTVGSSCEHGTCGSCRVRHDGGQVLHGDAVLSDDERRSWMTACVSRAKDVLIVDL